MSLCRIAQRTNIATWLVPVFLAMLLRWNSTVFGDIMSLVATCLLVSPLQVSLRMSNSVGLSSGLREFASSGEFDTSFTFFRMRLQYYHRTACTRDPRKNLFSQLGSQAQQCSLHPSRRRIDGTSTSQTLPASYACRNQSQ